jgi:hypothetical protein
MNTKTQIIQMYLDFVNDFITTEKFAEYYNLTTQEATIIIKAGRLLNSIN